MAMDLRITGAEPWISAWTGKLPTHLSTALSGSRLPTSSTAATAILMMDDDQKKAIKNVKL